MSVSTSPTHVELVDPAERAAQLAQVIADAPGKPCRQRDPEEYFPLETTSVSLARQLALVPVAEDLCDGCPVLGECRELADLRGDRFAIMGGTTPWQRRGWL